MSTQLSGEHSLEVSELSRRFGSFLAVDRVTFQVQRGEIFGYLGANGAGKSTTIRMLCGLLAPSSGSARVAGCDVARQPGEVRAAIGYMSQKFSLYLDLPVWENVQFFGGAYGLSGRALRERGEEVLGATGLLQHRKDQTGALPGGIRQRLALCCAMLHRPEVLFLDEPTAGVDPLARRTFWQIIRGLAEQGTTVFVTTHYLDEAEYCRRIGLMVDGRLVALDTPARLKEQHVPEQVLVARSRTGGLAAAGAALTGRPGVVAAEPFGAALHLRVVPGRWTPETLRQALLAAGAAPDTEVEPAEATLEDVFLAVVGQAASSRKPVEA